MSDVVIVGILSLMGTLSGSLFGIITSAKLTNFRLEQLEKKVDKHNNFAERIPLIENELIHIKKEVFENERTEKTFKS